MTYTCWLLPQTYYFLQNFNSIFLCLILMLNSYVNGQNCKTIPHSEECFSVDENKSQPSYKYSKEQLLFTEANTRWNDYNNEIEEALLNYTPCSPQKCSCHYGLIKKDLLEFSQGIQKQDIDEAKARGTLYQIINHHLFRDKDCMFPSRCSGIEFFILKIIDKLPDMEFVINTRDYPQVPRHYGSRKPVFSFSKTKDYLDITYPAWTFWEGGPAISIYPTGLGRWDKFRKSIQEEAEKWPWSKKKELVFFRGSRTSLERDPLIYISKKNPDLVDAQYTKNQAWKSDADTLYSPPAKEVPLESHCHYKYLFNYRGVAASFRLKHLFLCNSLVYHVGEEWIEFFYPQMKPWVHYIPVPSTANEDKLIELINFARENDKLAEEIANRGRDFIWNHLRTKDIVCYWKKLLLSYAELLLYEPQKRDGLIEIRKLNI
ncbi:O-glucosyltransferase rumi-like protein [Armadillidium nasatum]|uniref:O-glucosyltransferase rumi-like protein n=1 Tax=Armadillidium nasatum TaxID=96803 RepID=A0A5N5SMH9_9CRUS|nr:O-glucosyltransferase rumi-like protein [Armadillidium nasatum]